MTAFPQPEPQRVGSRSLGFEVQWNVYVQLSITVLMESILLWEALAAPGWRRTLPARC
jgi:hypothetical protein